MEINKYCHSHRIWITELDGVAICGKCGKFIFVKSVSLWLRIWFKFRSLISKECLACQVEDSFHRRNRVMEYYLGRKPMPTNSCVRQTDETAGEEAVFFKNELEHFQKLNYENQIQDVPWLRYNHSLRCKLLN